MKKNTGFSSSVAKHSGTKIKSNIHDEKNKQEVRDYVLAPAEVFTKQTKQHFVTHVISPEKHRVWVYKMPPEIQKGWQTLPRVMKYLQ